MFYRKYRPQTWGELDNKRIRESLGSSILDNNWSHAYLLIGKRGTGKTTTARLIAKTINCTGRKKGEEPCNKCDSCKEITGNRSMDVIEIDAASHTGVDDIRDLREKVKLAPTTSKYKVYIIDEVHMLSTSAFNALLKTLEEPPNHVVFILATTDPQKLPDTIISRCLVYDFGRAQQDEIISGLNKIVQSEKLEVADEVVIRIAQIAGGSHRDAVKILEQLSVQSAKIDMALLDALNSTNFYDTAAQLFDFLERGAKEDALGLIEESTGGDDIKVAGLTNSLLALFRDLILTNKAKVIAGANLWWFMQKLIECQKLSVNCPVPQLPLEIVVAQWCEKLPKIQEPGQKEVEIKKPEIKMEETIEETSIAAPVEKSEIFALITSKWPEIVAATKPFNHSLMAVLKAGNPEKMSGNFLIITVLYKFHKEKLEEDKNRSTLEGVISDIIGAPIKVKFELAEKR